MHQTIENIILKAGREYMKVLHEADLNDIPSVVLLCKAHGLDSYPLVDAIEEEQNKQTVKKIKFFFVN